jgi:hypothetical protein
LYLHYLSIIAYSSFLGDISSQHVFKMDSHDAFYGFIDEKFENRDAIVYEPHEEHIEDLKKITEMHNHSIVLDEFDWKLLLSFTALGISFIFCAATSFTLWLRLQERRSALKFLKGK